MIFVKNSRRGKEVNMINTVSKINLSHSVLFIHMQVKGLICSDLSRLKLETEISLHTTTYHNYPSHRKFSKGSRLSRRLRYMLSFT